jgi:hypothetical protein
VTVFSAQYPARLQGAVKHAERFCLLLGDAWRAGEEGRIWLVGRQEEVELVVRLLIEDWMGGLDAEAAASSVGAYLRALHFRAREVLEVGGAFACCGDGEAITVPPVDRDAVTRCVPAFVGVESSRASDTIAVASSEAMAEWLAKGGSSG